MNGFHKLNVSTTDVWAALLSKTVDVITERHWKRSKIANLVVTRGYYLNKQNPQINYSKMLDNILEGVHSISFN